MLFVLRVSGVFIIGLAILSVSADVAFCSEARVLSDEIARLVEAGDLRKMELGVRVEFFGGSNDLIFDLNGDRPIKPASNQKLLVAAAALHYLPADFRYRTIIGLLKGDLVVVGSGDPSLGDPVLARTAGEPITAIFLRWADGLKKAGMAKIEGDILFDDFIFDQEYVHSTWRVEQNLESWYAAPVGGLNFNDNCVDVLIKPAGEMGLPAVVSLIPETPWVRLDNGSKTSGKGQPTVTRRGNGPITIRIRGSVSKPNTREHPLSVAIVDPGSFFASTCRHVLEQQGINIAGETRRCRVRMPGGKMPEGFKALGMYERKLCDVLRRMNKRSQNMFAEALLKTLGAYVVRDKAPCSGSYASGRAVVHDYLKLLSVSSGSYVVDDGSGLSHKNRATPKMFTAVLRHMDGHPQKKLWWSSLAEAGDKEGSLSKRMKDLKGKVFGKTGHIYGVSALSGYVLGTGDRRYVFSILYNKADKSKARSKDARDLQDAICRLLATWEPDDAD